MANKQVFYTLKQIANALDMTPEGAKKSLEKEGISMQKIHRKWFVDPSEFHRCQRFSSVTVVQDLVEQPNEQLGQVGMKVEAGSDGFSGQIALLKQEIEMRDRRIRELENDRQELREERNDWKKQAQTLLLKAPEKPAEAPKRFLGILPRKKS